MQKNPPLNAIDENGSDFDIPGQSAMCYLPPKKDKTPLRFSTSLLQEKQSILEKGVKQLINLSPIEAMLRFGLKVVLWFLENQLDKSSEK